MKYTKGTFATIPNIQYLEGEKPQVQALYLWLCHHAGQSGECYPSQSKLAEECGMGKTSVKQGIARLEEIGLLKKETRKGRDGIKNETNLYFLMLKEEKVIRSPDDLWRETTNPKPCGDPTLGRVATSEPKEIITKSNEPEESLTKKPDEIFLKLARKFWGYAGGRFLKMNPKQEGKLEEVGIQWAQEFEKMERLDDCTPEICEKIIDWLFTANTKDSIFWAKNVQSPLKFRKKNREGVQYWRVLLDSIDFENFETQTAGSRRTPAQREADEIARISREAGL